MPSTRPFYTDDAVTIWRADALSLPIPDQSVDLIVTSPPYFSLRSYTDDGEHYAGQVGSEPTPREYVDALIAATREMVRVVKPAGSIWVNLGDKYAERGGPERNALADGGLVAYRAARPRRKGERETGIRQKSLMGLPWRYALRVVDDLGLILRRDQIWSKPNGLPESVTDRTRSSHEYLFHFVKRPDYYSAVDEIREDYSPNKPWGTNEKSGIKIGSATAVLRGTSVDVQQSGLGTAAARTENPLGKLPGSVWTIPTQPLTVPWGYGVEAGRITHYFTDERDAIGWLRLGSRTRRRRIRALPDHFAAFPMELPRRIIRGWSPPGICVECGEGRPVADRTPMSWRPSPTINGRQAPETSRTAASGTMLAPAETRITGYACACGTPTAPTRPAVVLDPFGGTGTAALVARAEGRYGWITDLSTDYCRLARWRVTDPRERARALQVAKPPPIPSGMGTLFDIATES